jgi:uncharacterized protein (TIGR00369 family)
MTDLRDDNRCFVCGLENPFGLKVCFETDRAGQSIRAVFVPAACHQGYEGIVHGGVLSALLDEAMAKLAYQMDLPSVTAELTVAFRAPASPGDELVVSGRITEATRRLVRASARIERGSVVIAEATGKLLKI